MIENYVAFQLQFSLSARRLKKYLFSLSNQWVLWIRFLEFQWLLNGHFVATSLENNMGKSYH